MRPSAVWNPIFWRKGCGRSAGMGVALVRSCARNCAASSASAAAPGPARNSGVRSCEASEISTLAVASASRSSTRELHPTRFTNSSPSTHARTAGSQRRTHTFDPFPLRFLNTPWARYGV